jgi:hypothetical protein
MRDARAGNGVFLRFSLPAFRLRLRLRLRFPLPASRIPHPASRFPLYAAKYLTLIGPTPKLRSNGLGNTTSSRSRA